ncbi:hypothetical protein HPB48_005696 [Haemaphysalis longicornis]|uniref:Uncharacterized protein n=1 Tax=Haemaphysalis longicornis TaxID=44386 RepID=A0A9J6H1Q5_HAELO|nr:hypothetical protein HPB48_005696 [Haemaphysalis longicornis]
MNEDIQSLAVGRPIVLSELAAQHKRFCELWHTFVQCDRIFSVCLLVSIPLNILNASPWGYYIITSKASFLNIAMDIIGFATMCAELFVLGAYGSAAQIQVNVTYSPIILL